ncbi:MAG: iron ABC transporter substrate-binding protein [Treponemataceae bacterium]
MKKKYVGCITALVMVLLLSIGCSKTKTENVGQRDGLSDVEQTKIEFVDMVGRNVSVNVPAQSALAEEPATLRLYVYVMGSERLLGVSDREAKGSGGRPYAIAHPELKDMQIFGGNYSIQNFEQVLLAKPDVFFVYPDEVAVINNIQEKCNVPVVSLDYGTGVIFDPKMYKSIELIGKCMGKEKRAKEVVDFMESCRKDLNDRTKDIPESKKMTAYAGGLAWNGPHGIEGTRENYPLFDAINAVNVVKGINQNGMVMVDKEKIIEWNPDVIIIDLNSIHLIQDDFNKNKEYYKSLKAFKEGRVYAQLPFVWCNENIDTAIADAYFIGKKMYPDKFKDIDPAKKADEIYKFLVGKELYEEFAPLVYGGFQDVTLEKLEANTYLKQ